MKFKELVESLGIPVFHNRQNATGFPYIIYTETSTSFEYASALPYIAVTSAALTLYTENEFDLKQLDILNLLVENKIIISNVMYEYSPETRCHATIFIVLIKHQLNYAKGEINYLGNV